MSRYRGFGFNTAEPPGQEPMRPEIIHGGPELRDWRRAVLKVQKRHRQRVREYLAAKAKKGRAT